MTEQELLKKVETFIKDIDYDHTTRPFLNDFYQAVRRNFRGQSTTDLIRSKQNGYIPKVDNTPKVPMPPEAKQAPPEEKKTETKDASPANVPEVIEAEQKDPTIEMEIMELFTSGKQSAIDKYKTPGKFSKKLSSLKIESNSKDWEILWATLEQKFIELTPA